MDGIEDQMAAQASPESQIRSLTDQLTRWQMWAVRFEGDAERAECDLEAATDLLREVRRALYGRGIEGRLIRRIDALLDPTAHRQGRDG